MDEPEFIVGEVSKNWRNGSSAVGDAEILSQKFERVIAVNLARGYMLHSWILSQMIYDPGMMVETIIAVFQRVPSVTL